MCPTFFYVGKGEGWQDIQFNSQFDVHGTSTIVVRYDNQIIYKQNINGKGELNFPLPPSASGFHRLDFTVLQKPLGVGQESNNFCIESSNLYTALIQPNLTYQAQRNTLQLNQLPDALFNSQLSRAEPIQAFFRIQLRKSFRIFHDSQISQCLEFCYPSSMASDPKSTAIRRFHDRDTASLSTSCRR